LNVNDCFIFYDSNVFLFLFDIELNAIEPKRIELLFVLSNKLAKLFDLRKFELLFDAYIIDPLYFYSKIIELDLNKLSFNFYLLIYNGDSALFIYPGVNDRKP
jgi:hypothetical protein